jgi:UDP-N-acetylglucosamine--N-acetylmuramyl-(pentapeptide) pyrophosphoryl-undecaprenol N-acetylglucosamine transferase
MPQEFAAADLLLCRSGASTMAELGAAGKASLLVPFALAADDHQRRNAEVFLQAGAARMLNEAELAGPERLLNELSRLLADPAALRAMGERARSLARPGAAHEIASMVVELAR